MAGLPDDVVQFIADHVETTDQIEILLLLRRQRRELDAHEVTAELRLGAGSVQEQLANLAMRGYLSSSGEPARYQYRPDSGEKDRLVSELDRCWAERRVAVIALVFSRSAQPSRGTAG